MKTVYAFLTIIFLAAPMAGAQAWGELRPEEPSLQDSPAPTPSARKIIIDGVTLGRQGKLEEAIASFQKALEIDPASLAAHINIATANLLRDQGEDEEKPGYIEAVKAIERASMLSPHDRQASSWMRQYGPMVIPYLDERASSGEDDPTAYYDLASAYMLAGETEKAIEAYEEAAALAPESAAIQADLGRALVRAGRTEDGERAMARAIELDPELLGALVNLGNLRYREGNLDEALSLYQAALEANPDSAVARAQIGNLYLKLGKLKKAKRELNAALKLNRHLIDTYLDLADVYLREKKFRAAIEQCDAAIKERRKLPEAEILLGELYYLERDYPNARKHFRGYLQTSRQHKVEDKEMVERLREHSKAKLEEIRELVGKRKFKKNSERLFKLAHRYYEAGDFDGATDAINKILETEEKMGKAYSLLGIIILKKGEPELAMNILRNALRNHIILDKGSRILTLQNLAAACIAAGRPDEAEEPLIEIISLQPEYPEAYYELARFYAGKDETGKSIRNLKKGVELEKKKRRKKTLTLILEEEAFEPMKDSEEVRKLREEFNL